MDDAVKFLQWSAVAVVMLCCLVAKAEDDPNALLKSKGLELDGSTWVLPIEADLNREMARLRQLSGALNKAQNEAQKFEQMLGKVNAQIAVWTKQHQQLLKEAKKPMPQSKLNRVTDEIRKLEAQINAAQAQGNERRGELNAAVTQVMDGYATELMAFYARAEASMKQYDELAKDQAVQAAIKASSEAEGRPVTLGPSDNFDRQWKTIEQMRDEIRAADIPLEKDGKALWVTVKINGQAAQRMVLNPQSNLTSLSSDVAQQLGVTVTPEMKTLECKFSDGRVVKGKLQLVALVCMFLRTVRLPNIRVRPAPLRAAARACGLRSGVRAVAGGRGASDHILLL